VDAIVELGEGAIEIPCKRKATVFVILETLEFFDEIELEFDRDPSGKLKGDILMSKSAAIATCP
jgi:hypothetical protein